MIVPYRADRQSLRQRINQQCAARGRRAELAYQHVRERHGFGIADIERIPRLEPPIIPIEGVCTGFSKKIVGKGNKNKKEPDAAD